jgi:methylmalonyl-CoA mutase N-terminal domain/subunit
VRADRSAAAVERALGELEETARGTGNLMPAIFGAVEAWATVGEISDCLRRVFGEYRE